ncbi:MAG: AsmA family protein, partial [Terriglobia bacterium]
MPSTWYRSRGFRIAAIVVGLLLVVLLLAPYVLSIDRYRPAIVEQLKKETGRDVEIEKIRLHFLPSLHVQVVNFRVKNPRGFPAGDTAAIESVDVGLAFWPLLRRQVEIGSVGVRNVEVNLLTDERGRTNYAMPRKRKTRAKKAAEGPVVSITQIGSVALEGVKVSSGTFWSRQKRVYPNWTATGINVGVRNLDLSDPKWLRKAEADLDLSTIEISVPALKEPLHFTDGEVEVKENTANGDFTLALGSLRANGTVKVANLERPVADFALAMKELNVAEIGAAAAQQPKGGSGPHGSSGAGSRQLLARGTVKVGRVRVPPYSAQNVQGKVRLYGNRLEVDPFTLAVYGGKTRGTLTVNLDQASMPAQVSLKAEGVNVAQAMAAASPKAKDTITGTFEADGRLGLPLGAGDPLAGLSGQGNFAVRNGTFPGLNV